MLYVSGMHCMLSSCLPVMSVTLSVCIAVACMYVCMSVCCCYRVATKECNEVRIYSYISSLSRYFLRSFRSPLDN